MMIFFYLPFFYTFHTRLTSLSSKLAWITTYLVPVFIIFLYLGLHISFFLILVLIVYSAYELGYIFNDCEVIKREENPTLRLKNSELHYYESNKIKIFLFRLFSLVAIYFFIYLYQYVYFFEFVGVLFFIILIYFFYNSVRNNLNLILYSFLVFSRYFIFFIFVCSDFILLVMLFLSYPMCALIEFSTKKRFFTSRFIKISNFDKFRVYYYSVLFILSLIVYFFDIRFSLIFVIISFYFFVYRLVLFVFFAKNARKI